MKAYRKDGQLVIEIDIVERLRSAAALPTGLYAEAADEIEGLRQRLAAWRAMDKQADRETLELAAKAAGERR